DAPSPGERARPGRRRNRALAAARADLRCRRRSTQPLLSRSAPPAAGTLAVGRRRGTARAAQARRDPPLPDRPDRAAVAALRQGVERGNPTAARSARQASGHAGAREPDGAPWAARTLALAPRRRHSRTPGRTCR